MNCTGMWGRQVAARNAVPVPLQAMPHYYVVTTELPGFETSLSGVSVSDEYVYVGPEGKGLLVGFFEPGGTPWAADGIPEDASFTTLAEDWDHLGKFYESDAAVPGSRRRRDPSLPLGPRELHPRRLLPCRTGGRHRQLLGGGGVQLERVPLRAWHRCLPRPADHGRCPVDAAVGARPTSRTAAPDQRALPQRRRRDDPRDDDVGPLPG